MAKGPLFTARPAIPLPLAVRKDIRDNFEYKNGDFKARIEALLGTEFNININAEEVWAYAEEGNTAAGGCFAGYVEGFISALENFISKYGESGRTFFNEAVTQSELTLAVNPLGDKVEAISSDVKDGVYRILFRIGNLGYNQIWQNDNVLPAIEAVPREGFTLSAKSSMENDYEPEIDDLNQEINKILGTKVTLDPNFQENYKVLRSSKVPDKDWQTRIGKVTLSYFKGLKWQLEYQGFEGDTMIQEGFQEVITSKTFRLRVVLQTLTKTETVVEDGVVYLQCAPNRWGSDGISNEIGRDLLKLL